MQLDSTMSLPDFFATHPVFTREELVRHLTETGEGNPNASTVRALLRYHQTTGRILSVRRGLFATVAPGSTPSSTPVDAYLVGALGCPGGVLAYHAALELHGLAYSTFEEVQILVPRHQRGWSYRGVEYRPVQARESLGDVALTQGVETMDRQGINLQVTTVTRTLVDVLDRPDLSGGWEEVWRSLETVKVVEDAEALAYLERLGTPRPRPWWASTLNSTLVCWTPRKRRSPGWSAYGRRADITSIGRMAGGWQRGGT